MRILVATLVTAAALTVGCSGESDPFPMAAGSPFATATPTATRTVRPTPTIPVYPSATPFPAPPFESTRISWQGGLWYLHGASLPWYNWGCDFGCGSSGGVSSAAVTKAVSTALRSAKASGVNVVRWWMFPGEPDQFILDGADSPAPLKPEVYDDIDAALALAERENIYLVFVLFSAPTHVPQSWTTDPNHRRQLAATVGALAGRYRSSHRILAWEIFNEPEWDIEAGRAKEGDVVATVDAVAEEIHTNSPALVTVGSATIQSLGMWADSELDFYSPHWYDPMAPAACARCTDYASLRAIYGLTKPVIVGEFFAGADVDAAQRYLDFYEQGYAGAWGWSLLSERTQDKMTIDLAAAAEFGALPDVGPR